jgi:DNA-binding transcriptional MerR regulator
MTHSQKFSIAEIERETGIKRDTLRVWERRYGFPTPLRNEQGVRMYPSEQLSRTDPDGFD